jgi:hypothetical protein
VLASLRGAGKIQVGELALGAFRANSVRGVLSIDGRTIQFTAYEAQFYKGRLTGEVRANLDYRPLHDIKLKFDRVDLESLAAATPTLEDKFGGIARGELELRMQGATRAELVDTLAGQGLIDVRSGQYRGLDLDSSYAAGEARPGLSRFAGARIEFHVGRQSIQMDRARLASAADDLRAQGSVDFARTLNLQIWREGGAGARSRSAADSPRLSLTGTLAEPQIGPAPARVKMR